MPRGGWPYALKLCRENADVKSGGRSRLLHSAASMLRPGRGEERETSGPVEIISLQDPRLELEFRSAQRKSEFAAALAGHRPQ
jgi:hypothetical protein